MSEIDLSGRFDAPLIAGLRLELSKSASTASCNMRFSFRMMISGAFSSMSRIKRLLRWITRRYRSLRSEVAKRPPSSCTIGRKSGGITGITLKIIHSGLFPDTRKFSTISMRRSKRLSLFAPFSIIFSRNCATSASRSRFCKRVRIASAPIPAVKPPP